MRRQLVGFALAVTLTGCGVSSQQEIEMGGQYAAQINQQLPIINDPEANRYIKRNAYRKGWEYSSDKI